MNIFQDLYNLESWGRHSNNIQKICLEKFIDEITHFIIK